MALIGNQILIIFPDGSDIQLDTSYSRPLSMGIGEALIIEGKEPYFKIKDIQHQVRNDKYIMTIVILEDAA